MEIEHFSNEERVLINGICNNENLSKLTKADALNSLTFSRAITDEGDEMLVGLLDGLIEKLLPITDEEWDNLKMKTPFPVAVVAEDEVSEVPADEDIA